jgi:pullulanase/glycogen debranching enzyme
MCLTDELSENPKKDGTKLTEKLAARSRLGATMLFTSIGIPMLSEGQAFLRSKFGLHNTFDRGDGANALRWNERERPLARQTLAYYIGMSRLRSSKAGRSFRVSSVPDGYYKWLQPRDGNALGYMVNMRHQKPGAAFVVLVNAESHDVVFDVPFGSGNWRLAGDGKQVDVDGIAGRGTLKGGTRKVRVPAISSYIFVREN